jgi:hypothetical protein
MNTELPICRQPAQNARWPSGMFVFRHVPERVFKKLISDQASRLPKKNLAKNKNVNYARTYVLT